MGGVWAAKPGNVSAHFWEERGGRAHSLCGMSINPQRLGSASDRPHCKRCATALVMRAERAS